VKEFSKTHDRNTPVRFKLNTVDALESARAARILSHLRRESHNCIQAQGRRTLSFMRQRNLNPVGETRESHFKMGMSCVQVPELLAAGSYDGSLQLG
jgi:hypothetical protein